MIKSFFSAIGLGLAYLCAVSTALSQSTSPSPATAGDKSIVAGATNSLRTDIYHVHFAHSAVGKAADLGDALKAPGPNAPAAGHMAIFRHQYGDSWDYCAVSHFGTKFTIEANRPQISDSRRDLSDWHTDTICNGPSWAEFSRAMGLDADPKKTSAAVYIVSYYRAAPGQRDAAEKNLAEPPNPAQDKAAGIVIMQHLEGAAWNYVAIVRYNSWQDMATSQVNTIPDTAKKDSPWSQLRAFTTNHTDTLCDRIAP
jgi:hypothetical protein